MGREYEEFQHGTTSVKKSPKEPSLLLKLWECMHMHMWQICMCSSLHKKATCACAQWVCERPQKLWQSTGTHPAGPVDEVIQLGHYILASAPRKVGGFGDHGSGL
jgi:hypothetical protein